MATGPTTPEVSGNLKNTALLEQRREELVDCATAVFVERRFDRASVNDIAERCGWSIGSLYRYVSSKEDILVLVCDAIFRNLSIGSIAEGAKDNPVRALEEALNTYFDGVYRNHEQVLLMYREYTQLPEDAQRYFREREEEVYNAVADIVSSGVKQGVFECDDPKLFAIDCVVRAHTFALKRWALGRRSGKEIKRQLIGWSLRALGVAADATA
jgi:TetR/AcrR family transcriptional regulator, cholesterol catabolism regulator